MTIGELKKILNEYDEALSIIMCMDWTELGDECPEHLKGQWEDELNEAFLVDSRSGKRLMLLNKHFK